MINKSIFKAYDIRGIYKKQIDAEGVFKIAQAYIKFLQTDEHRLENTTSAPINFPNPSLEKRGKFTIVVGHDMRLSGEEFSQAAIKGLSEAGADVIDIGLVSTDQLYFAVATLPNISGGIQITASHNPKEYAGMKLVREGGRPISGETGLYKIRDWVASNQLSAVSCQLGTVSTKDIRQEYFDFIFKLVDVTKIKPFKIVANTNFGMATQVIDELKKRLPISFLDIINPELDGNFPKGPSDPLLPSNRDETIAAIVKLKPDLGVAWDGDADRCFFFDELGNFITPAYISALMAKYFLQKNPGAKILHDTRVVRVIDYVVEENGGIAIMTRAGHSLIKERMMQEQAVFGCETSAHYYFKDNFYLDNGLIPFLIMLDILSTEINLDPLQNATEAKPKNFSQILAPLREKFFISEEINFEFNNQNILEEIKAQYKNAKIDNIDGYDFNYPSWRFNVRLSNTQNLLRINLEADSAELLAEKTKEVSEFILKRR